MKKSLIIVGFFILVTGLAGGVFYYWQKQRNEASRQIDETANRRIYRDDQFGFEFRYPPLINGKKIEVVKTQNGDEFIYKIFNSEILGPSVSEGESPYNLRHFLELSLYDLKNSNFFFRLNYNVFYNNKENQWYITLNGNDGKAYNKKLDWDDIDGFLKENSKGVSIISENWPLIKTADGIVAYPVSAGANEETVVSYSILDKERLFYLNLHFVSFIPDLIDYNLPSEFKLEENLIGTSMKEIISTLKFTK